MRIKLALCAMMAALPTMAQAAAVRYSLDTVALDGSAGENTYIARQNNTVGGGLGYTGGATPSLQFTMATTSGYSSVVGKFDAVSLTDVGDKIFLNFAFKVSSTSAFTSGANNTNLRVGLFDSNGSAVTADSDGGDSVFNTDKGYAGFYRPQTGSTGNSNVFSQRLNTSNQLMLAAGYPSNVHLAPNSAFGNTASPILQAFGINSTTTTYTGSFSIERLANGVRLTSIVNGGTPQTVDDLSANAADYVTSFDEFAFFGLSGTTNPVLTFSELTVTVPEPTMLGGAGLAAVALLARRRRSVM